jgi:chromosome partitioning protein
MSFCFGVKLKGRAIMATVISVLNQKGGVGKTTIATNLARGLILKNYKTLLVDGDPQGSARDWHAASDGSLVDCLGIDRETMPTDIQKLTNQYEVIVIDGAPQIAKLSAAAIRASDVVIIPVQPSPYDIWATSDLVELIKCRQEVTNGMPLASFLISRQIKNTLLSKEVEGALLSYGFPVLKTKTYQTVAYPMSAREGKSIFCEKSSATQEFMQLVEEIIENYLDSKTG